MPPGLLCGRILFSSAYVSFDHKRLAFCVVVINFHLLTPVLLLYHLFSYYFNINIILRSEMSERSIISIEPPKKEAPSLVELELEPTSMEVKVTYLCI